jgi:addiction module HigA family antidote
LIADARARPASPRAPVAPGHFLETRYLRPLAISQQALADALGISRRRVNEFVRGRRAISPDSAVRLAMYFGNEPGFWLQLQAAWDAHLALKRIRAGAATRAPRAASAPAASAD